MKTISEEETAYCVPEKERKILAEMEQVVKDAQLRFVAALNFIAAREQLGKVDNYDTKTGAFRNGERS